MPLPSRQAIILIDAKSSQLELFPVSLSTGQPCMKFDPFLSSKGLNNICADINFLKADVAAHIEDDMQLAGCSQYF